MTIRVIQSPAPVRVIQGQPAPRLVRVNNTGAPEASQMRADIEAAGAEQLAILEAVAGQIDNFTDVLSPGAITDASLPSSPILIGDFL